MRTGLLCYYRPGSQGEVLSGRFDWEQGQIIEAPHLVKFDVRSLPQVEEKSLEECRAWSTVDVIDLFFTRYSNATAVIQYTKNLLLVIHRAYAYVYNMLVGDTVGSTVLSYTSPNPVYLGVVRTPLLTYRSKQPLAKLAAYDMGGEYWNVYTRHGIRKLEKSKCDVPWDNVCSHGEYRKLAENPACYGGIYREGILCPFTIQGDEIVFI